MTQAARRTAAAACPASIIRAASAPMAGSSPSCPSRRTTSCSSVSPPISSLAIRSRQRHDHAHQCRHGRHASGRLERGARDQQRRQRDRVSVEGDQPVERARRARVRRDRRHRPIFAAMQPPLHAHPVHGHDRAHRHRRAGLRQQNRVLKAAIAGDGQTIAVDVASFTADGDVQDSRAALLLLDRATSKTTTVRSERVHAIITNLMLAGHGL
jgi:hypothetical protein